LLLAVPQKLLSASYMRPWPSCFSSPGPAPGGRWCAASCSWSSSSRCPVAPVIGFAWILISMGLAWLPVGYSKLRATLVDLFVVLPAVTVSPARRWQRQGVPRAAAVAIYGRSVRLNTVGSLGVEPGPRGEGGT
jgi:hypothetical protein